MNRPLRALIVDDEPLARDRLRELLAAHDDVEVVAECRNGRDAVERTRALAPDVLFLDVQMPELDGLGAADELGDDLPPAVVFVTAYDQYALQAFDVHAVDYLLKPFEDERFEAALERAREKVQHGRVQDLSRRLLGLLHELGTAPAELEALSRGAPAEPPDEERDEAGADGYLQRLSVRSGNRWTLVDVDEIDWIEGAGVYARLVVGSHSHLLRTSLSELAERLDPARMVRVHRSTIVNLERVREVRPRSHGEYILVLHDGTRLKVSRTYRAAIRDYLDRTG